MIIFEYQNSTLLTVELESRCHCSRWYSTTCSLAYTLSTSWTAILRDQYSLSRLRHVDYYLFSLSCSSLWLWKACIFKSESSQVWHVLFARTDSITSPLPLTGILYNYFTGDNYLSREFHNNIQQYNAAFAMTLVGVKTDNLVTRQLGPYYFKIQGELHHLTGALLSHGNQTPIYMQIYICNTAEQLNVRRANNNNLDSAVMDNL